MLADPADVGIDAIKGAIQSFDENVFRNDTPVLEYAARVGKSAEDFANASPDEQAEILGKGIGITAFAAVEVVVGSKGAGQLAPGRSTNNNTSGGDTGGGANNGPETDADTNNPSNGSDQDGTNVRDREAPPPPPPPFKDLLDGDDEFIDAPDVDIPYGFPINAQGEAFEQALDATGALGERLALGAKTFDFFDQTTGVATSAKTLNTLTDPRLQAPETITSTINGHINAIINYRSRDNFAADIPEDLVRQRSLIVAIPWGTNAAQRAAIDRSVDYAQLNGITIRIVTTGR